VPFAHAAAQISVNRSTPVSQVQRNGPTGSAYVTYCRPDDALRCIEAVDGQLWDGEARLGRARGSSTHRP
jgi:hypothetical protein